MEQFKRLLRQVIRGKVETQTEPTDSAESAVTETQEVEAPPVVEESAEAEVPEEVPGLTFAETAIFSAGWVTDTGRVRGHNEDALLVFMGEQASSGAVPPFGLFVLADGMGGHQSGELASALASRVVAGHLIQEIYAPILHDVERVADQPSLNQLVEEAVTRANEEVRDLVPGSGTTLTCGMVLGERLFMGHVGDSRGYLLRQDEDPKLLTYDHSLVRRLVDTGQLTAEEADVHPQRNVLYRAIGQEGNLDVDVFSLPIQNGDKLLLCSDGLWGMVSEMDIWRILANSSTPKEACLELVKAANAAGGNDNITVILVEISI